ncbi:DUF1850 domain-containing protein [Evansella clarkii]|uniref:DUF1850 domain-containing protein n=1 Tax=Evansella clarkii TaxID=79879 RepID=UPI000B442692|nr:DUF1850 domain-containing protein [Evansella clarkii]
MNSKGIIWGTVTFVLLFFLFFRVSVIKFDFGDEIYYLKENQFHLKWIHSVEKEEWVETYEKSGGNLILTETYFKTYGAGVPSDGKIIESHDGYIRMKIDREMNEFNLTVSENAETTIETDGRVIPLYDYTEDYEYVNISLQYISLWEYVGGPML